MGKRKTRKVVVNKKRTEPVPKTFKCPFCNYDKSVECKMDRKRSVGTLTCRICGASFQAPINALSDPIDVYSEWIDECERVNEDEPAATAAS